MMTVAVRIHSEIDSMSISGLSICSALPDERQPPTAPWHGYGWHPDRALPVLGKVLCRHIRSTTDQPHHSFAMFYLWCNGDLMAKR